MKKGINTNKAMIRALAVFLAIFGLTALSIAGLLEFYASAVATVNVEQGVVIVDSNSQEYGYQNPYSVNLTATAGDKTEVTSFTIRYKGNHSQAPVNVEIALGSEFEGLFEEIKEYNVTIDSTVYEITQSSQPSGVSIDTANKKITISGITLDTTDSEVDFKLEVVWNPATEPKTYTLTVTALPA